MDTDTATIKKALLVDDHALFRDGVDLLVEQRIPQLQLSTAGDIAGALDALEADPDCSLVLLDLGLPDASGMAVSSLLSTTGSAAEGLPRGMFCSAFWFALGDSRSG